MFLKAKSRLEALKRDLNVKRAEIDGKLGVNQRMDDDFRTLNSTTSNLMFLVNIVDSATNVDDLEAGKQAIEALNALDAVNSVESSLWMPEILPNIRSAAELSLQEYNICKDRFEVFNIVTAMNQNYQFWYSPSN